MSCKPASLRSWPSMVTGAALQSDVLPRLLAEERQRFIAARPKSAAMAKAASAHWQGGVPLHWMGDWASPFPIFAASAHQAQITDIDGLTYDDFCLGDTPSMFGHGLEVVARALSDQALKGTGFMLPTTDAVVVGQLLTERFGLPFWQTANTATDANRAAIRWARAVTGVKPAGNGYVSSAPLKFRSSPESTSTMSSHRATLSLSALLLQTKHHYTIRLIFANTS